MPCWLLVTSSTQPKRKCANNPVPQNSLFKGILSINIDLLPPPRRSCFHPSVCQFTGFLLCQSNQFVFKKSSAPFSDWHIDAAGYCPAPLCYLRSALKEGNDLFFLGGEGGGRCTKTLVRHMRIGTKSPIMPSHIHSQGPGSDALIQPSLLPWLQHANSNCASSLEKSYPKGRTRSRHWAAPDNDTHAVQYPSPTRLLSALSDLLHIFGRTLTVTGESNCRVFFSFWPKLCKILTPWGRENNHNNRRVWFDLLGC